MSIPYRLVKNTLLRELKERITQREKAIEHASHFVKEIEKGNLDIEFVSETSGESDDLRISLVSMRDQLKKIALSEKERNWVTEGLAKFADILRQDSDDLKHLVDNVLSNLIKYMDVNQGALFILNEDNPDDPYLELLACYAYNRKKFLEKRINVGEGLVGQAYLEKEPMYLTEIPHDYVSITSGLGEAPPKNILIVPLKVNDQIYGVVELASFHLIKSYQQDFVARLGESIASTISSVRITHRTKTLLEESQQQAEEMRAQEEEVRQNMEELSATQEEMQRILKEVQFNEKFMKDLLDAYPDTIFTFDRNYRLINFNKVFEANWAPLGFRIEKGFEVLSLFEGKKKTEHRALYDQVLAGESFVKMEEIREGNKLLFYSSVYAPLRDARGEVVGGALFARDITDTETIKRNNEQLLAESQAQTEILKAQEDMVRQNLDELSASREEAQRILKETQRKEQFMNDLIDASGDVIMTIDKNYCIINFNKLASAAFKYQGLSLEKGKSVFEIITTEEKKAVYKAMCDKALAGETVSDLGETVSDLEVYGEAAQTNYWQNTLSPLKNAEGVIIGVAIFTKDVTEIEREKRKNEKILKESQLRAEELSAQAQTLKENAEEFEAMQDELNRILTEIREKEYLLKEIVDNDENGVITFDKDYRLLTFNKAFEKMLQEAGIQCTNGMDALQFITARSQRAQFTACSQKAFEGKRAKCMLQFNDLHLSIMVSPLKNSQGKLQGATAHLNNVTEIVKLREAAVKK